MKIIRVVPLIVAFAAACTNEPSATIAARNSLGVVGYRFFETGDQLEVAGVDASGQTIVKLAALSGPFEMSDFFAGSYLEPGDSRTVIGRRVQVDVLQNGAWVQWSYETPGTRPVLHMPPPLGAPGEVLQDPTIKERLAHFGLGHDTIVAPANEVAYDDCSGSYECGDGIEPAAISEGSITSNRYGVTFYNGMTNPFKGTVSNSVICGGGTIYTALMVDQYSYSSLWAANDSALFQTCHTSALGDFYAVQTCVSSLGYGHEASACDGSGLFTALCTPCSMTVGTLDGVAEATYDGFNTPDTTREPLYSLSLSTTCGECGLYSSTSNTCYETEDSVSGCMFDWSADIGGICTCYPPWCTIGGPCTAGNDCWGNSYGGTYDSTCTCQGSPPDICCQQEDCPGQCCYGPDGTCGDC